MAVTLAFDVYGTLIDTHGLVDMLQTKMGDKALAFSQTWREKQLEYSFRRGLMQNYRNFAVCTGDALDYACAHCGIDLSQDDRRELLELYRVLPPFKDVAAGLARAKEAGFRIFAFSNGSAEAVRKLLEHAGISEFFIDVVSVDEMMSFKPNPAVYSHFLRRSGATGAEAWLVSGNSFDVIGAISAGMRAAWVRRSPEAVFDPWGVEPTLTVGSLADLAEKITQARRESAG